MITPEELLEQSEIEAQRQADELQLEGVDRREFVFMSLTAAAATTFGFAARAAAQSAGAAPNAAPQAAQLPAQLGNGEPVSWTFQPYPAGTGALMEKLVRERGAKAFDRTQFKVEKWSGTVPTSDEDIAFLPAHRLSAMLKERKITSTRLTQIYLERLKRYNPTLLFAVTIMESQALAEAARADEEIKAGKYRGPLHGLPYGVKDLFTTKGVPTTWGAADFENRIIDEDAEVVVRLRDAGAVLLAKLSTGLFAQNDQWFRGRTNNPWNLSQGSSGSSAGPGSATAVGCVAFSIGTETQGSIVSPSIRCGISALRPTFGRVSRHGGMVLAWSHDRVGPMCRSAEDCAMVFSVIHGLDEKDPSTLTMPFAFDRNIKLSSLRIGFDPGKPAQDGAPARQGAPPELVAKLRELGANLKEIGARPPQSAMNGTGFLAGGGLNGEYAAAFDEYVQRKAKETGLDLTALPDAPRPGGGGAAPAGGPPPSPMAPADWNPRFVNGRTVRALDFIQLQRRRYAYIVRWAEFMKDLDLFVGAPQADTGANAQTGHPCAVLPYKFEPPAGGGGGGRGGNAAGPALNPQPICGVITGDLYKDDVILSVAHLIQRHSDFHSRRPTITT
ncbi:MAG TPA: amidase [Gemmatimonadaceae bacterium]|nr:amidase [Gemmatimonadaceae bacterium]